MGKLLLAFALLLGGCQTVPEAKGVKVPASLMQECTELVLLEGVTGGDLLKNITANAAIYHDCRLGKKMLIEAVKASKK